MENTTIAIKTELKKKIMEFGMKGESYEDIIKRIYNLAVKEQIRQFLMPSERYISIDEAIKEAEKLWPKSR